MRIRKSKSAPVGVLGKDSAFWSCWTGLLKVFNSGEYEIAARQTNLRRRT